ncbi:MAG: glycosyl transferase [Bacteroides sp.]|nr:glycosyl transferase [Bacteroides sp.]
MKHAFLIIAHNEPEVLKVLLSMLDDERNDIYLHIDKRAEELYMKFFSFQMKRGKLYLLKNRMKVYWGDISQVEVEYLLFEVAFAKGNYVYYHLLSGVDLPIKSQDYIHSFFNQHKGKEFVSFWQDAKHERDLQRKTGRYYLFTKQLKNKQEFYHHVTAFIRNIVLAIQKVVGYKRKSDFDFKKGSQWVSITNEFCSYLIDKKKSILKVLQFTLCPDEIFVQTILWNSPFKKHIYSEKDNMRKIDWMRGNPYVWHNKDWEELQKTEELFARKFSSIQREIIYNIYKKYHKDETDSISSF